MKALRMKQPMLAVVLAAALCCAGGFYTPVSVVVGIALGIMLIVKAAREGKLLIGINPTIAFLLLLAGGYLVTALWGVDKYNSIAGFVKFLPLPLFALYIGQTDSEGRSECLRLIAPLGAVMTVVSFLLSRISSLAYLFAVSGRISGFFEYSNTFALFLIVGIILTGARERLSLWDMIILAINIAGVFLTGSRTSFVVLIFAVACMMLVSESKGFKIGTASVIALAIAGAVIYFAISGRYGAFARFLTISSGAGTLQGRLLYFKDAIRVIARHPFGLGYMGYYFLQGSFQTGVYSNQFVHNELLQLLLDIGWIPAVAGIACVVHNLLSKKISRISKLILIVSLLHSMMDFDFQFIGMAFVVILCLDVDSGKREIRTGKPIIAATGILCACLCVLGAYIGVGDMLYLTDNSERAAALCSHNTMAQLERLEATEDNDERLEIAEAIIKGNKHASNAYGARALYYYNQGDIEQAVENEELALDCSRYFIDEYTQYCYMLIYAMSLYSENEDYESMSYCAEHLLSIRERLEQVEATTDKIAYRLNDKPELELPEDCSIYIEELSQSLSD